jgi:hypothetical protein
MVDKTDVRMRHFEFPGEIRDRFRNGESVIGQCGQRIIQPQELAATYPHTDNQSEAKSFSSEMLSASGTFCLRPTL